MERNDGLPKIYQKSKKTKRKITQSLLDLLDEKPLDQVTIQEICDRAGVHRTTFYKHFGSIFDVIHFLTEEMTAHLSDVLDVMDQKIVWFDFLANFVTTYHNALVNLNKTKYKEMIVSPLSVILYEFYDRLFWQEKKQFPDTVKREWLLNYHVAGTVCIVEQWLDENCSYEQCRAGIQGLYEIIFSEIT